MARGKKFTWASVRLEHLAFLTNHKNWRWGEDRRTHRLCLLTPTGKVFDFRARPAIEIREHKVINEHLL